MSEQQSLMQIPEEIEDSKIYQKMVKEFGESETRTFFKKSESELRAVIAEGQVQKAEAKKEVDENENFQNASAVRKAFLSGLRDVVKPINTKINAATLIVTYLQELKKAK